jgi:hypothetical protein
MGIAPVQALPQNLNVQFGSSRSAFTTRLRPARRWSATTSLEYVLQGGLDPTSLLASPLLSGLRVDVALAYDTSRTDAVETRVDGARSISTSAICAFNLVLLAGRGTICAPESEVAQATESLRHRFGRRTQVSFGAGASATRVRVRSTDRFVDQLFPVAVFTFAHGRTVEAQRAILRVDAQLAPLIDVRSGIADYRAQGALTLSFPIERTTLIGSLSATQSINSQFLPPITLVRGDAGIEYRVNRQLSFGGGVRAAWQHQEVFGTFSTAMTYVELTVRIPPTRL